jgi:acetoin utilization protein AcuB
MNLHRTVADIMTKKVVCVEPQQPILDLKHIYEGAHFHHHIPVTENGKLTGIVSLIDFMRAISEASLDDNDAVYHSKKVSEIMSIHPISVSSNTTIGKVAEILAKGEIHSIVVADNNEVVGIVTTADIIKLLLRMEENHHTEI